MEPQPEILYKTCRDHVFKCEECRERLLKTNADQQNNIPCEYAQNGCDWRGRSTEELDAHTTVCPKQYVQCLIDGCEKGFRREELNAHLQHHITSLHTQIKTCLYQPLPLTFTIPAHENLLCCNKPKEYKFPFYTHQGGYLMRLCVSLKLRNRYIVLSMESISGCFDDRLSSRTVTIKVRAYSSKKEETFEFDARLHPTWSTPEECGTPYNCDLNKFLRPYENEDFHIEIQSCSELNMQLFM